MIKRMPELCDNRTCTGCGACANICSTGAIKLLPEKVEGFLHPKVDSNKCIKCLKCERACPIISPLRTYKESDNVYAAWNLNQDIRTHSSSGGVFSAIAKTVIDRGGIVIAAAYDSNMNIHHIAVDNADGLSLVRGSKYFQSAIEDAYKTAKHYLQNDREVLFCGTPCQIAGIRNFLGDGSYDKLTLVDFICHGVPSPLFFKKYLEWLTNGKPIDNFNFRDKHSGWQDALRSFSSDKKVYLRGKKDAYWIAFNRNSNLQESCYDCKFLGIQRMSDITLADFWGIGTIIPFKNKKEITKGISMLMVNTEKGQKVLNMASEYLSLERRSLKEVLYGNQSMIHSSSRPTTRDTIYIDLNNLSFYQMIQKYMTPTMKERLVKLFREYLPKPFITFIRNKSLK